MLALSLLPSSLAFSAPAAMPPPLQMAATRPALAAMAPTLARTAASQIRMQAGQGVPLTGQTLAAALKIRTDTTGAAYAIYWAKFGDTFKPTGSHVADSKATGYVAASMGVELDANGDGPVATVKRSGDPTFVTNVVSST